MKLPTLYKTAKTGATQVFNIEATSDSYTVTWGQVNGKQQQKTTKCSPKNVGKKNESTATEQAVTEAKATWAKKIKLGYSEDEKAPVTVKLPMKVNEYNKHKKKIEFPCFTSVKLNGVNVEYRLVDDELKLLSRGGEEYPIPDHQREDAIKILKHLNTTSINGEMYKHGEHLQDIQAATKKHNDLTPSLKFYVFDFPNVSGDYNTRCSLCYPGFTEVELTTIFPILVSVANSHDEINDDYEDVVDGGYEGLIIRNSKGQYEYNTRSLDVFKYKPVLDAEFEVEAYNLDKNGHAVFVCRCGEPPLDNMEWMTFRVKLKGTNEERLAMAAEADNYIGKYLKVEYETLSKDGIPLKPVGIMFRKVDANGEAAE